MSKPKSTSTSAESEIKAALKELEIAQKAIKSNTEKTVGLLKNLIDETPEVLAIRWSQYTPGFNDGDPCEFSVNDLEVKFNPEHLPVNTEKTYNDRDEEDEDDGFVAEPYLKDFFEHQTDVITFEEVSRIEKKTELFYKIHQALAVASGALEAAFGNNTQITVTKDGIETEDYECGY